MPGVVSRDTASSITILQLVVLELSPVLRTEPLLLAGNAQRTDQFIQMAVDHRVQIVHGEMNAVIGDATLREIVRTDFRGAVTGADHGLALARPRRLLFGDHA